MISSLLDAVSLVHVISPHDDGVIVIEKIVCSSTVASFFNDPTSVHTPSFFV